MWCLQGRGKQTPSSPGAEESMGGSASNKMHNAAHESSSRLFAACRARLSVSGRLLLLIRSRRGFGSTANYAFPFWELCVCGRVCGHRIQSSAPATPHTSAETVIFTSPLSVPRQKGRLSLQLPHPWEIIQLKPSPRR